MSGLSCLTSRTIWLSLLLLLSASKVHARRCFEDGFGNVTCTGLSNGARIGIAIAVFVVIMVLLLGMTCWRRRRLRERNLVYLTNPNAGYPAHNYQGGQSYNPPPGNPPPGNPQYPPEAYVQQPYNNYTPGHNKGYNNPPYNSYGPDAPYSATK